MTETVNEAVLNDLVGKVIGDVAGAMSLLWPISATRPECLAHLMVPAG